MQLDVADPLEFMMGGAYKFCFTTNGNFNHGAQRAILPIKMKLQGVYDYESTGELRNRPYYCYLRKKAYYGYNTADGRYSSIDTSCRVWFGYSSTATVGFMLPYDGDRGSWSAEFELDSTDRSVVPRECGGVQPPADFICNAPEVPPGACNVGSRMILPSNVSERTVRIPAVAKTLEGPDFKARTVAACYCPGYLGCDDTSEFVQQVGLLHFYLTKICDPGAVGCLTDYTGVTPQYRFKVVVQCPTDACRTFHGTRLKVVQQHPDNDLPSWMSNSGCRLAQHGMIELPNGNMHMALAQNSAVGPHMPFDTPVTPTSTNPTDCHHTHGCPQTGYGISTAITGAYEEQDYKEFGGPSGFQFIMGNTNHEARNFYQAYNMDTCFCNEDCQTQSNWFKVGTMRLSPTRLVSSATAQSNLPAQWTIEFTKQTGIIGIYRSYDDEYTMGLQEEGMLIKIVEDQLELDTAPERSDLKCWKSGYDPQLIQGPSDEGSASFNYAGTSVAPETNRIIFNAGFVARTITVNKAGRIAVCYCGRVDDSGLCIGGGDLSMNWRLLAHISIKGPKLLPQQYWSFSTMVNFRFSYVGYGLSPYDTVRIIDFSGNCEDDNYNPNRAAYPFTFIKVGCPLNCQEVTLTDGDQPGDLTTRVRTSGCSTFDRNNVNCVRNDIEEVHVVSDTETELLFQDAHGFQDGDEISLGENYHCKAIPDNPCTLESVGSLKGVYEFQDIDNKDYQAPSTYMTPHLVRTVPDEPRRLRINIGWPAPVPEFEVVPVGVDPLRNIAGEWGQWTHHTMGWTKQEIVGEKAKANMKVCWSYGRPESPGVVKYVEEAGLLTITDPAVMEGATVSITSLKLGQAAPMIIQFRTATSEQIGLKYDRAEDSIRLKIIFTHPDLLDIHKTGLLAPELPYDEYVDYEDASQQACGMLFLEFWSEDMERGFPLPKGCHFRSYDGTEKRRELEIVFEPKSGLRKNTLYQIVFNAHIKDVLEDVTYNLLQDTFMQLIPMDDVTNRPYEAIERGDVILDPYGRIPKPDSVDLSPEFSQTEGFKILGGYNNLLELQSGDTLAFQMMGGHGQGTMIQAGCRVRIFLWPLTQWQTTSSCTANCIEGGEISFLCDYIRCEAEAVVPGMTLNIIKLTLGELNPTWVGFGQLYNNKKVRIRVGAITMPAGGFFANRLAAEVTDAGITAGRDDLDQYPNYVHSIGDLIWKAPTEGQTIAKVVSVAGGGNTRPYRMEHDNTLYARLILTATLLARDDTGEDCSFTITLPEGYTCKQPPTDAEVNHWAAPVDLPAFDNVYPHGRGTPDDGTPNHGWVASGRLCTFTPQHPYGVIYAGSSMVVKIVADNPDFSLPRSSSSNLWTFNASSRGLCGLDHCFKQGEDRVYNFLSSPDLVYQSNNVVLGRIQKSVIQPSNFHLRGVRDKAQALRVFFQTEQEVPGGGEVRVRAPPGFNFGFPCDASDLEDSYYATSGNPETATLRLPVDRNVATFECATRTASEPGRDMLYQEISVRLRDILLGGRYFGFKVHVDNPEDASVYAADGWRIYTADSDGYLVDGTPQTVPFIDSDGNSWGVYSSNDTGFKVHLGVEPQIGLVVGGKAVLDMRPYAMSGEAVYVTLVMHNVPVGNSGLIRVVLPDTYTWDFSTHPLLFRKSADPKSPSGYASNAPSGITDPFPPCVAADSQATTCSFTAPDDQTIIFSSAYFSTVEVYGFAAPIRIPSSNPAKVSNAIFLEMGYTSSLVDLRRAAASIPLPNVRVLKNADVDYTTSIIGKETGLQFTIQTVTPIPKNGYIQIRGPLGMNFSDDCYLMPATDPAAPPPPDLLCEHRLQPAGPRIRLFVKDGVLEGGFYQFLILAENPKQPVRNYNNGATPCGTDICWLFNTFRVPPNAGPQELDYETSAQGYSVNRQMLEARIPPLTSVQTYATGRDDRPTQQNNVIFAFQLSTEVTQSGIFVFRAPYGFEFLQQCTPGIDTNEATLYGLGNRFPDEFTVWPTGVVIQSCRGAGRDATLNFTVAQGAKLAASSLYVVRIGNFTNPLKTPSPNQWNIELSAGFDGEASEPIEGMPLWAFTQTSLTPVATARDQTLAGEVRTRNPLRFVFRPYNNIPQEGELRAAAPSGFQFAHLASRECDVQLRELPYVELGVNYPGYEWPTDMLVCLADEGDSSKVSVRLRDTRPVQKGLEYELILIAYNARVESTEAADWVLQSYLPGNLPLDESRIFGFVVNNVMEFKYVNSDPSNPGEEVRNGKALLPEFNLRLQFPDVLTAGDKIVIIVPEDFIFTDFAGSCVNFRWVCDETLMVAGEECIGPLSMPPICNKTLQTITFLINDFPPIPQETLISFGLDFINPARTMDLPENSWRCTHYGPSTGTILNRGLRYREESVDANLPIYSSKAFTSWDIIPQMENVLVDIIRPGNLAAGSISAIEIQFKAVNDAEDIAIQFVAPDNFEFGGAKLDPAVPEQELLIPDSGGGLARVRTVVTAGLVTKIVLRNVRLGAEGGQTVVKLTSWTGGMLQNGVWNPGEKKDERLNCGTMCSFTLPGLVDISYEKLQNQYHQNPDLYPVQSRWEAQMGRPAQIQFLFACTQAVKIGHELWIHGKPYQPTMQLFTLAEAPPLSLADDEADDPASRAVQYRIKDVLDKTLKIIADQPLAAYTIYQVVFSVIAPTAQEVEEKGEPITWSLETWAYPYGELPTNTNDGETREFPIVEEYSFQVLSARAPPIAEVEVALALTVGIQKPTTLIVVAPLLFNFSSDCLVSGGSQILSCSPSTPMPDGRKTAALATVDQGISGSLQGVIIKVQTPAMAPLSKAWFIEGRNIFTDAQYGWGEAEGIEIEQMAEIAVTYPGIPAVLARMVWRFKTQVLIESGGWLHMELPEDFNPQCSGTYLEPIALPATGGCRILDSQTLVIYLNATMVPGEYAFGIHVTPPTFAPLRNELTLILYDRHGNVRDAAVDLPGLDIQDKLKIQESHLQWTSSKPLRSSVVTLGFEAVEPLPDLVVAPVQQISEILITFPVGFTHLIDEEHDFTVLNEDMPFKEYGWLDFMQKDRLRVMLNLNQSAWMTLKTGVYQFRFPVLIPSPLPIFNVWYVALCSPNYPEGCNRITDPAVMVVFPIPGFKLNQEYGTLGVGIAASAAHRRAQAFCNWSLGLGLLLVALSSGPSLSLR